MSIKKALGLRIRELRRKSGFTQDILQNLSALHQDMSAELKTVLIRLQLKHWGVLQNA